MTRTGSRTSTKYSAQHVRVSRVRGKPKKCELCGTADPTRRYEWSLLHGRTGFDPEDYVRLCKSCHRSYDVDSYIDIAQILAMRDAIRNGETQRSVASRFNVGTGKVRYWTRDLMLKPTEDVLADIALRRKNGETIRSIARSYGITRTTIYRWLDEYYPPELL